MSHRRQQLESTLKRTISQVISIGLSDPRVEGSLISVTSVEITPDMSQAIVQVSILPADRQKTIFNGLRHATRHIHAAVTERVRARSIPQFRFELDESLKKQAAVLDAIRQAVDEDDGHVDEHNTEPGAGDAASPSTSEDHSS